MFFIGITLGRALSGFLTIRLRDPQMIRLGSWVIGVGILFFFLPGSSAMTLAGLILVGLGCAPIYPCIIHATPAYFGADRSQAIIGVQMASAYVGTLLIPPLFGLLANHISVSLLPYFLLCLLLLMAFAHRQLGKRTAP